MIYDLANWNIKVEVGSFSAPKSSGGKSLHTAGTIHIELLHNYKKARMNHQR